MLKRFAALLVAAFFAGTGCAPSEESTTEQEAQPSPASTTGAFVGQVQGSDALLGLVSDGKSVAGFLCDGIQLARWIRPTPVADNISQLASRDEEHFMGGVEFFEGGIRGEVFIDDAPFSFEIAPATGRAGIYWQTSSDSETGWVVANDGEVRGLKQAGGGFTHAGDPQGPRWIDPNAEPFQAAPE